MNQISKPVAARDMASPLLMASGRVVDLENLRPSDIHWPDLVENLAKIPRFNGATEHVTYTVAQHCCLMYDRAEDRYKAHALLYDFAAAFFGEPTWPFLSFVARKTDAPNAFMDAFKEAKGDITDVLCVAAGLSDNEDDEAVCKRLDYLDVVDAMLTASEVRDLMHAGAVRDTWKLQAPFPFPVKAWGQDKARAELRTRLAFIGVYLGDRQ
ncbi:MAG: hypothetical protein AAFX90_21580 [Pseudomonadota bacterium]